MLDFNNKKKVLFFSIFLFVLFLIWVLIYKYFFYITPEKKAMETYKKDIGIVKEVKNYEKISPDKILISKIKKIDYDNKYIFFNKTIMPFGILKWLNKKLEGKKVILFSTNTNKPYKIKELKDNKPFYKNLSIGLLKNLIKNSENQDIQFKTFESNYLKKKEALSFLERFIKKKKLEDKNFELTYLFNWKEYHFKGPKQNGKIGVIFYNLKNGKVFIESIILTPYYNETDKKIYEKYFNNYSVIKDKRLKKDLFNSYHKTNPLIFF